VKDADYGRLTIHNVYLTISFNIEDENLKVESEVVALMEK
jgi:hypothetical protein